MAELNPEEEIVMGAIRIHRMQLETHNCEKCLDTYEALLWIIIACFPPQTKTEVEEAP